MFYSVFFSGDKREEVTSILGHFKILTESIIFKLSFTAECPEVQFGLLTKMSEFMVDITSVSSGAC